MPELLDELNVAKRTGTFRKVIDGYREVGLLILDEWLIRPLARQESYNRLEIVEARINSPKGSMIFCTQYETDDWYGCIDPEFAEGVLFSRSSLEIVRGCRFGGSFCSDNNCFKRKKE